MLSVTALLALVSLTPQDPARLTGVVTSSYNGLPLEGVTVGLPGARRVALTDSTGAFDLAGLPDGELRLRIHYQARTNTDHAVELQAGKTQRLVVLLDLGATDLNPVVVTADRLGDLWGLAGFYYRRATGWGFHFTPEDIARRHAGRFRELLDGTMLFWGCLGTSCGPNTFVNGRRCALGVRIDGIPAWGEELDAIPPEDLGGVEIYRHSWVVPWVFGGGPLSPSEEWTARYTAGRSLSLRQQLALSSCGTVLVWTRDYRSRWES